MSVRLTHKKLFNLEPETDYIAYVSAVTSAGAGPMQSVIATTRQYARVYLPLRPSLVREAEYCDERVCHSFVSLSVCLSVCASLSASISQKPTSRRHHIFCARALGSVLF